MRVSYIAKMAILFIVSILATQNATAKKPNVLFIAVDDLRPTLGAYGNKKVISPNIDELASKGIVFENAYASVPTCGASRASLLTGIRPTRERFKISYSRIDEDTPDATTLPKLFKEHGYQAISLGKITHRPADIADHWSEKPIKPPFNAYHTKKNLDIQKKIKSGEIKGLFRAYPYESAEVEESKYFDGRVAELAVERLGQLKNSDKPFFLAVGFSKPHLPFSVPKKYWDMYPEEKIVLPTNYFNPRYAPRQAISKFGELRGYYGVPKKGPVSDEMALKLIHGYHAAVSFADAQVGKVLAALDENQLRENTIIVLWGDHGWQIGEHKIWNKHSNFKTGLHSPLIFSVPGKKQNLRTSAVTEFVDIFPTLCDLVGLPKPKQLQGESVASLLDNPDKHSNTSAYGRWTGGDTIFTERYAYTEWSQKESGKKVARMLFDHSKDPDENVNIAERKENEALIKKLAKMLEQKKALAQQ